MTSKISNEIPEKSQCSNYSIANYNCLINEGLDYAQKNTFKIILTAITWATPILIITYGFYKLRAINAKIQTLTDQTNIQSNYIRSVEKTLAAEKLKLAASLKIIEDIQSEFSFYKLESEETMYLQNEELKFYRDLPTNAIPALVEDAETSTSDLLQYYATMCGEHTN